MSYVQNLSLMIILSSALTFAGCSSTTTPDKPEPSAAAAATPAETKKKVDSGKTTESTTKAPPSSSLDALQRGESTATPASSPLKDVYFDFDRYDLRADSREILKANSAWLKANASAQVQIEGHCDERGTTEYNVALGSRRAESVKDYLVTLGTSTDRLST
ncbi:MAG TPA: OmpA family protein, partial [Candidatus Nitrosocosmicus sp.]|nr:OmpA family protein [Candidatus Nitrosocosmicus sp.]